MNDPLYQPKLIRLAQAMVSGFYLPGEFENSTWEERALATALCVRYYRTGRFSING